MEVFKTVEDLRRWRREISGTLGLVTTMGYLHRGHVALVERARAENDIVAASIFANPLQFGVNEDFARYPRDLPRDLALLEQARVNVVFAPAPAEIYPPGFSTSVDVEGITDRLEGASRPGHFRGVATVLTKLFNIFQPDRAYFGQKDAQQVAVVGKMVRDLNMPLRIVSVPTVRDNDGLALSSRNVYLSPEERRVALAIPRSLQTACAAHVEGVRDADSLRAHVIQTLHEGGITEIDYVSLADASSLEEIDRIERPALLSLAVRVGKTRLIDNVILGGGSDELVVG